MLRLSYPLDRIDFRPWACAVLAVENLEHLHMRPDPAPFASYVDRLTYYKNMLVADFGTVTNQYRALTELIAPLFDGMVLRQPIPSIRCHLSGAGTASAFHRDGDPKYGIEPGIINAWVPLTPVYSHNSLYIESERGSEDYRPVVLQPGEFLLFDAFNLKHGSYANDTSSTRVSFDFRFLPNNPDRALELGIFAAEPAGRAATPAAEQEQTVPTRTAGLP